MFILYQSLITLIILFSPIIVIYRILNDKEDKNRFREKFGFPSKRKKYGKLINEVTEYSVDGINYYLKHGIDKAMNNFNLKIGNKING